MKFRYRTEQERATKKIPIPRGYHARTQIPFVSNIYRIC